DIRFVQRLGLLHRLPAAGFYPVAHHIDHVLDLFTLFRGQVLPRSPDGGGQRRPARGFETAERLFKPAFIVRPQGIHLLRAVAGNLFVLFAVAALVAVNPEGHPALLRQMGHELLDRFLGQIHLDPSVHLAGHASAGVQKNGNVDPVRRLLLLLLRSVFRPLEIAHVKARPEIFDLLHSGTVILRQQIDQAVVCLLRRQSFRKPVKFLFQLRFVIFVPRQLAGAFLQHPVDVGRRLERFRIAAFRTFGARVLGQQGTSFDNNQAENDHQDQRPSHPELFSFPMGHMMRRLPPLVSRNYFRSYVSGRRSSKTGMVVRTRSTAVGSISTVKTASSPSPSARTSPQGSTTIEWPPYRVPSSSPTRLTATTNIWFSTARAWFRIRQCRIRARGHPAGTNKICMPSRAMDRTNSGKRRS